MNIIFMILYWVILETLIFSAILFRKYQNHQILGVIFSIEDSKTKEVSEIVNSYKKDLSFISFVFLTLGVFMLFPPVKAYADFFMLILMIFAILIIGFRIKHSQEKLIALKLEKGWIYPTSKTVLADLSSSREKGKSAVSIIYSYILFLLSFIPFIYLLFNDGEREEYPLIFSLIGPFIQILMVLMYKQALKSKSPVISENSEINKALSRTFERINTVSATFSGLVMFLFYMSFSAVIIFEKNSAFIIAPVIFMICGILLIAMWRQKRVNNAEEYFMEKSKSELFSFNKDGIYEEENFWRWGFYNNPNDKRLFVPKRISGMGWTINIARPFGKIFMMLTVMLIVGIIGVMTAFSVMEYDITKKDSDIKISGVMYHTEFDAKNIVSVKKDADLPSNTRTNGYGGSSKSCGHFSVSGYGPSMFYIYNDVDEYIIIKLKNEDTKNVFINEDTKEKTDKLYDYFKDLEKKY